jgi:hypothetical protein
MTSTRHAEWSVTATASVASWAAFYDLLHPSVGAPLLSLASLHDSMVQQVICAAALGCACRVAGFSFGAVGVSAAVGLLIGSERADHYLFGVSVPRWQRLAAAAPYMTVVWVAMASGWWLGRSAARRYAERWASRLRAVLRFVASVFGWGVPYFLWLTAPILPPRSPGYWVMFGLVAAVSGGLLSARAGMTAAWTAATLLMGIVGASSVANISDVSQSMYDRVWGGVLNTQVFSVWFAAAVAAGWMLAGIQHVPRWRAVNQERHDA